MLCQPTANYEYLGPVVNVERAPEVYLVEFETGTKLFVDEKGCTAAGTQVLEETGTSVHEDDQCVIAVTENDDMTIVSLNIKGTDDVYTMSFTDEARDFFRGVFSGT